MTKFQQLLRRLKKRRLLISITFTAVACGICFCLFSRFGPIFKYWRVDFSFLLVPFIGYYILRLLSRLSGSQIRSFRGKVAANVLTGLAGCFFCYGLFSQALLFTRVTRMAGAQNFFTNISHMTVAAVFFFGGYTVYKISRLLTETHRDRLMSPAGTAAGQILIGCGLWQGFAAFSSSWSPAGGTGLMFFVAMVVMALSSIGSYGQESNRPIFIDASNWLKEGPTGKFFLGGFVAAYLLFVRPAIFSVFSYAYLVEWLVFCLISWRIFASIRNLLQKRYSHTPPEFNWQSHIQEVNYLADEDFVKLVVLQKDYVNYGDKWRLLEYIKKILIKNGLPENQIGETLSPILEHKDVKAPWYSFVLGAGKFNRLNRQKRRTSLQATMLKLADTGLPSRQ